MIRVLHIVTSLAATGVPTLLYSYYSRMDREKIQFDFVAIPSKVEHTYKQKFEDLGCQVYYMPKKYVGRIPFLYKLMKNGHYDVVHSHIELASAVYLSIALVAGVKVRIAHAHMAFLPYTKIQHKCLRYLLNTVATLRLGCSKDALIGLFGNKEGIVLHNAIDIDKFNYNPSTRKQYREQLNIDDRIVLGFVGRFTRQKNVFYILEIFKNILELNHNALLLIAGDGEQKDEFFEKADQLHIRDYILYLGSRNDIPSLMMAMDGLLLPSLWEGLGIVLIEAQAAALMTFTSRYTVPYEDTNVSQYIHYLDITEEPIVWARAINQKILDYKKISVKDQLEAHHYDINIEKDNLLSVYENAIIDK